MERKFNLTLVENDRTTVYASYWNLDRALLDMRDLNEQERTKRTGARWIINFTDRTGTEDPKKATAEETKKTRKGVEKND